MISGPFLVCGNDSDLYGARFYKTPEASAAWRGLTGQVENINLKTVLMTRFYFLS